MRVDEWTSDDDLILAEITLRHIREGNTQLNAFDIVAERLKRTSAACAYRWNSTVRNKYKASVQIAKDQRNKRKGGKSSKPTLETQLLREENERLMAEISDLRDRNRALTMALNSKKMDHLLPDEEEYKPRFRMDENGNLTRIE